MRCQSGNSGSGSREAGRRGRGTDVPPHARLYGICGRGVRTGFLVSSFHRSFPWSLSIFWEQAWAEGKGKLARCRHRADSDGETVKMYDAIV